MAEAANKSCDRAVSGLGIALAGQIITTLNAGSEVRTFPSTELPI